MDKKERGGGSPFPPSKILIKCDANQRLTSLWHYWVVLKIKDQLKTFVVLSKVKVLQKLIFIILGVYGCSWISIPAFLEIDS